jgi:hypothetical protein
MSGYANINAYADPNVLLATQGGQAVTAIDAQNIANQYAPQRNQLFISGEQQKQGETGIEYMARAAQGLLDPAAYPDEASRAAAYPGVVAHLQSMGLAPNAPTQYPGVAALHQVAMMGTPSEKLAEFSANRAFGTALSPPQPGTAPPGGGGGAPVTGSGTATIGQRQNNPGNLEFAGQPYASPGQGNRFAAFPDMPTGVAANADQLALYQTQHGINTVRGAVGRWVEGPNPDPSKPRPDLTSYIGDISKALGVGPDQPVDFTDPKVQAAFIQAQFPHESAGGGYQLNPADVQKGVQMAAARRGQQVQPGPQPSAAAAGATPAPYRVATTGAIPPPPTGPIAPPSASTAPPAGPDATAAEAALGLPPRNAMLPAAAPVPPAVAQAQPQPAAQPPPPPQVNAGPPPPSLPPLNANQLNEQQQRTVDAMGQSARFTPQQQVQQIEAFRQNNIALQQKAYSDWIQAQQLAVSQGQLSVSQANSNLERYKADPVYQGAVKRMQEMNSNVEVRGVGNFMINADGTRTFIPQPYPGEVIGSGGAKVPGFTYPGGPGQPSTFQPTLGPGGQPVTASLSPEAQEESKGYGELSQGIIKASAAAPVSLQRLDVLQNAADSFRPGSSAAMRLAGGKVAVDALQTLGITPPPWLANGAAAGETIGKEGGYLAAEMTRALGSHEAASVFSQVKNIQPNLEMSQGGFQAIINSVRQGLQRDQDIGTFREQWLADPKNNNSIRGMTDAFEKAAPIEAYASRVVPYPMPKSKDAAIPNVIYNTGQGPMLWNGTAFEELPTR